MAKSELKNFKLDHQVSQKRLGEFRKENNKRKENYWNTDGDGTQEHQRNYWSNGKVDD